MRYTVPLLFAVIGIVSFISGRELMKMENEIKKERKTVARLAIEAKDYQVMLSECVKYRGFIARYE